MNPALNPLVLNLKESATLAINIRALELRKEGREISHFGFGQSPFPIPENIQEALRNNSHRKEYLPTRGLPELLEVLSTFYKSEFGYNFEEKNICVGPGSKELIFQTLYLLEGPLLVPSPSWVSYGPQAALRGKEIIQIETSRENGYKLTPEELDRYAHSVSHKQKMLILNNPNNPTGAVYSEEEIQELAKICRAYGIIVISDEIYAMIDFNGRKQASMSTWYPEGTIVTGGMSKSFASGGYRFGLMMIPDELYPVMESLKSIISETFSSVCAPVQYAALEAYGNFEKVRPFIKKTSSIYSFASRYLHERFTGMGLNCPEPEGAFYLFPDFENFKGKFPHGIMTGFELCEHLLNDYGIAVLPGSDFYFPATNMGVRVASVDFDGGFVLENWDRFKPTEEEDVLEFFPNLSGGCDRLERFLGGLK